MEKKGRKNDRVHLRLSSHLVFSQTLCRYIDKIFWDESIFLLVQKIVVAIQKNSNHRHQWFPYKLYVVSIGRRLWNRKSKQKSICNM